MTQAEYDRALTKHGVTRSGHWLQFHGHGVVASKVDERKWSGISRRRRLARVLESKGDYDTRGEHNAALAALATRNERDADLLVAHARGFRGREAIAFAEGAAFRGGPDYTVERDRALAEQAAEVALNVVGEVTRG